MKTTPIKGLDESVTITVTRTPGRPSSAQRLGGKPASFALMSPTRNGRNSDALRLSPREELVCPACQRVFKYKAAYIRHEAQCGLPIALRIERSVMNETFIGNCINHVFLTLHYLSKFMLLLLSINFSRAALIEAKKQEKAAEMEKRRMEEKQEKEKEKLPDFRCSTCLKQFNDNESYQRHNFEVSAACISCCDHFG